MGQIRVTFEDSFDWRIVEHTESALKYGHADAVERMISHLKLKSLPLAIAQDLDLASQGVRPDIAFGPTVLKVLEAKAEKEERDIVKEVLNADVNEKPDTT